MKNDIIRSNMLPTWNSLFRDEFITSIDNVFNKTFEELFPSTSREFGVDLFTKGAYPKVNILDEPTRVVIEAEIPGLSKENVSVQIEDGILYIHGKKKEDAEGSTKKNYVYRELKHSSFVRSFKLNESLDQTRIDAKFENGLLEIFIPKKVPSTKEREVVKVAIK